MEIVWDPDKAAANPNNHAGVTFEEAKHVFFGILHLGLKVVYTFRKPEFGQSYSVGNN